ncbi:hypothetical protein CEQ90_10085 [Lewinellaceae bacterium SD302]|nr:hypothetical protein CEQ90_10085 [Lewinellaceae bacterium SD302]
MGKVLTLFNSLLRTYISRYADELASYATESAALQRQTLADIILNNEDTVFGREHGFADLVDGKHADYAARLPVRSYEEHLPYIERTLAGESAVLTAESPEWVATTSGTTGATKYLPLCASAIRNSYRKGSWLSLACLYNRKPDIQVFSSNNLLVGGSIKGEHPTLGVPYGDISAIMIRTIPKALQYFYIPDMELATQVNYEDKIERIAQLAAKERDITVLGGVPTWNLPLFRRILEIHGGENMLDVWPNVQAFKHGGVNFGPYRSQFEALFPSEDFVFQEIYNATEGFFAVQDLADHEGMKLLLTNGIYYEFVPFEAFQRREYERAVPLAEVETGEVYVMLITTNAGLYRYPMGDLIEFTTTHPYRLRILGRTQEFINAFGEDLLRAEAEDALKTACAQHDCEIVDFTIAPRYTSLEGAGCHEWFIEFLTSPSCPDKFRTTLDEALQSRNYNYAAKRLNDFGMGKLRLHSLPTGFFRRWLKQRGKLGGQHKVPRLANHREFADSILGEMRSVPRS